MVDDEISGTQSSFTYEYTLATKGLSKIAEPSGDIYTIRVAKINPLPPYQKKLQFYAARDGADGISSVLVDFFIPVLGVIQNDVPNFYPGTQQYL